MEDNGQPFGFKVCVRCLTYNHSQYIVDTMNGFCTQRTDFPYVCIIVDDASPDGAQEVIRSYVREYFDASDRRLYFDRDVDYALVSFVRHKTNTNCFFVILNLKENHFSSRRPKMPYYHEWRDECIYEALCEGDDWWTNPDKLQQQVLFLDSNPSYSICHTDFDFYVEPSGPRYHSDRISKTNLVIERDNKDVILSILDENKYRIQPCTVMYRLSSYEACSEMVLKYQSGHLMGDTQLWCCLLRMGDIHYLSQNTGVYRIHTGSACHSSSINGRLRFILSSCEMRLTIVSDFGYPTKIVRRFRRAYINALCSYLSFDRNYQLMVPLGNTLERLCVNIHRTAVVSVIYSLLIRFFYKRLLPFLKRVKKMFSR